MAAQGMGDGELLGAALALDIWTDPPLAGIATARFEDAAHELLQELEEDLARRILAVQGHGEGPPGDPISDRMVRAALHELAVGTALVAQSRSGGNLDVDADAVRVAGTSLAALLEARGPAALPRVYLLHATALNYRSLRYYGEMRRSDFAHGTLHRPWCDFDLAEELERGISRGEVEAAAENSELVRLTRLGLEVTSRLEEEFRRVGVLRARDLLRQGSLRDLATGARSMLRRTMPQLVHSPQELAEYLRRVAPVPRIVEVSSIAGTLVDWARDGLLGDAEAICCGSSRARLLQIVHESSGRVKAVRCGLDGRLPFEDGSVDFALLPATPLRQWMRGLLMELRRILGPGGYLLVSCSTGWGQVFPKEVRDALPPLAQDFLRRTDSVRPKDALEASGFAVEASAQKTLEGVVGSAQELADLLGETGVLAEIHANMPIAAAERSEDWVLDACAAAVRAAHGRLPFSLMSETVFGRRQ